MSRDWNPGAYAAYADLRLRPALDLLAQVPELPEGEVVDLGCGAGAVAPALRRAFAGRTLVGIDNSPAMLQEARASRLYARVKPVDIEAWSPDSPPALIFSNAVLQWLDGHEALLTRLAKSLARGGTLAVQMPRNFEAPSHALLREISAEMFPDRFDFSAWLPPVARPEDYVRLLGDLGAVNAWETTYVQRLEPARAEHPVLKFTGSTAMRPFLDKLDEDEAARFNSAYEAALAEAYPVEEDGAVLFPFRRVFFTLTR